MHCPDFEFQRQFLNNIASTIPHTLSLLQCAIGYDDGSFIDRQALEVEIQSHHLLFGSSNNLNEARHGGIQGGTGFLCDGLLKSNNNREQFSCQPLESVGTDDPIGKVLFDY